MKALVATACVAIIAATGYYFVSQYRAAAQAKEAAMIELQKKNARMICFGDDAGKYAEYCKRMGDEYGW